jgi:DNA-binding transcriptional LysR family regulator
MMELDQPDLVNRLVEAGVAWAFVSRLGVAEGLRTGRLVDAKLPGLPLKRDLYAAWHRDKTLGAVGREFLERLGEKG